MASTADQDKHLVALQVALPSEALQQEVAAQVAAATWPLREQVGLPPDHFLHVLVRLNQPKVCMLARLPASAPPLAATLSPVMGLSGLPPSSLHDLPKTGAGWLTCCALQVVVLQGQLAEAQAKIASLSEACLRAQQPTPEHPDTVDKVSSNIWLWHRCCAMQLGDLHGACGVQIWL